MPVRYLIPLVLSLGLLSTLSSYAQQGFGPGDMTSRRLGYIDDASAVGWNPAMLGMSTESDLLFGTTFDRTNFKFNQRPYAVYSKLAYLGLGAIMKPDGVTSFQQQYYAGLGIPLSEDELWGGISMRWFDGGGFFSSGEVILSGTALLLDDLLASITFDNITSNNNNDLRFYGSLGYSPFDWAMLHVNTGYDPADTLFSASAWRTDIGLSLLTFDDQVIISGTYDFDREAFRTGVEVALSGFIVGAIGSFEPLATGGNPDFRSGIALARYSTRMAEKNEEIRGTSGTGRLGWAPERAYTPVGLEYRYSVSDAAKSATALERPCTGVDNFSTPASVYRQIASAGSEYAPLSSTLQTISPNPDDLYKNIRREFYSQRVRSEELMSGDSLAIVSRQGYSIGIQNVDNSRFPQVSVIMQVTDADGQSVRGLGKNDFAFRDESVNIISVKPIDSTLNIPVDVVMIIDCSGSMGEEIQSVRENAQRFVDKMEASGADYRIGGVLYGSVIYDTLHPTKDFSEFRDFVSQANSIGGDEISTLAIKAATEMDFRPNAQKVFVLISDDWIVQDNATLTETDLTEMLWNTGAKLYSIINKCKNNNAITTRLALGQEYDITSPFNSILDGIGTDITTTYQLVYESKLKEIPLVTLLRGKVRDETGRPVPISFSVRDVSQQKGATVATNPTTGEYELEITEGKQYEVDIQGMGFLPLTQTIDLRSVKQGDTVQQDFSLRLPLTTLAGKITDEKGNPTRGRIQIEDAETLQLIDTIATDANGGYETPLKEGRSYRLTPVVPGYIPTPADLDARGVARGTQMRQDLRVTSIDEAIASGATFRLQNIFFDYDKADLKPESFPELNKLIGMLNEYPVVNVEVGAHTDSRGSDAYNQKLSEQRAQSVVNYLVQKGIVAQRLSSKGYGEIQPVGSNDTDEGRALNRRVEFKLVK